MAGWLGLSNLVYGIIFAVLCGNFMAMMRCKKPHYMGLLEQELVKYEDNDLNSSTLTASSNDKIESP